MFNDQTLRSNPAMGRASRRPERGVALLIVITILVTMVLVAVPFAMSMRQGQERTRSIEARGRAEFEASLLAEIVKLYLGRGHPDQEQRRYDRGERTVDSQPMVDSLDEMTPNESFRRKLESEIIDQWSLDPRMASRAAYLKSRNLGPLNDDRGSIWTVLVQDAQALVNVNGASPFLLANLLGSATLSDELDTGGGDISVENVVTGRYGGMRGFAAKDGVIRIGREVITYEEFDGEVFRGCERGMFQDTPLEDNGNAESHPQGTPVIDYAAYKLGTHLIARRPGSLTPFRNLEALRDIASWGEGGVISAERLERLLPYLTVWSRRETSGGWLADQLVMNQLPESLESNSPDEVQLRDFQQNPSGTTAYFNPGTITRVTNGVDTVYQMVERIGDEAGRRRDAFLALAGPVSAGRDSIEFKGGETTIAAYAPYPININTASREVLYAVMANLQFYRSNSKENIVTPELAWTLAGDIVQTRKGALRADTDTGRRMNGPFRHAEDFGRFLEDRVRSNQITRAHSALLYTNAINSHNFMLRFGTAPWCYRSLDVYHVEARVALNNQAGEQIAEAGVREVVEIGSDTTAAWTLDSQQDFEQRVAMGSGAKWVTSYPFGVAYKNRAVAHIQPALREPKGYINHVYPSTARGEDLGDIRLEPSRLDLPGAQFIDHFDTSWYADGHYTGQDGAYTQKAREMFMKTGDNHMRPFSMSFWWRPYSDADWTAFDTGVDQFKNRIGLFVQNGEQGQELTFRVCAGNLWGQGAEVFVPMEQLDYQPGNWYHIHVSCAGEDPATMQLLVDGVDIGKRRGMTHTSGSISVDGTEIAVESTSGFPPRGAVRIGLEIVEYDTLTDTAFRDCIRSSRGTTAQEFPNNTPVHMVGYSMPITVPVMTGGAALTDSLGKWSCGRVSTLNGGQAAPDSTQVPGSDPLIPLKGFGPERTNIEITTVGMWGQDDTESAEAFGPRGIALLGCPQIEYQAGGAGPASPEDDGTTPQPGPDGEEGGDNHTNPGDGVPPGGREPPSTEDPTPQPVPNPDGGGGDTDGGDGDAPVGGDDGIKLGGWEVVYYERTGNTFTIERFVKTAWQGEAEPYFLITEITLPGQGPMEFPAYLVPISMYAEGAQGDDDYLDPAVPEDAEWLAKYYANDDRSARVLLGTDIPMDEIEVIRYDSIDRQRGGSGVLFVRDRGIGAVTGHFFGDRQTITGGGAADPDPTDDPDPVPQPEPEPPPVPPTEDPGDGTTDQPGPGGEEPGGDPTPGDGVPPGQRDVPEGGGGGGDPEPGPVPDGGGDTTEPLPDDGGSSGGSDSGGEDDEPVGGDETEDQDPDNADQDAGDGENDAGNQDGEQGSNGDGGGSGAAGDDTTPQPEEPSPDDSGGGGDFGDSEGGSEEGGDAVIPDQPAPGLREPTDGADDNGDTEGDTGSVLFGTEPTGPGTAKNMLQFRGVNGTQDQEHAGGGVGNPNSLFLPCFRTYEGSRGAPVQRVGRNDVITLLTGIEGDDRVQMGVRWGDPSSSWAALDDFVDKRFDPDKDGALTRRNDYRGRARVLKFPCGELPDEMGEELEFGQSSISDSGLVTAFLDELHVWRNTLDTTYVVEELEGVNEEASEIRLINVGTTQAPTTLDGFDQDCGLVVIEGELVIYRGSRLEGENVIILEGCARGQLGTKPAFHPRGGGIRFIPDYPVSYIDGGVPVDGSSIPLARTRGWPKEGLARIVREESAELVHYTRLGENELVMPVSIDADEMTRDRGLFRGRFGTDATDHDSGEIVVFQPFRFWDRFTPRRTQDDSTFGGVHAHPETSYFEFGKKVRSGYWRGFSWSENLLGRNTGSSGDIDTDSSGEASGYLDIYVLARFNPNVPWDSTNIQDLRDSAAMTGKPDFSKSMNDSLFLFDDVGSASIGAGRQGNDLGVPSDNAEFRVYMVYKANAFEPMDGARSGTSLGDLPVLTNTWKQTPWMKSFTVSYFSRTVTRYRAAVR